MTAQSLLSLVLFSFVSSITPGPNNVMLTASGSTFGYRRSLPHMLGITSGVAIMVLLVGVGLGKVFEAIPLFYTVLKYVGCVYLVYLAWRIARARSIDGGQAAGKPFTFIEAAVFQWVNPKAWVMAVGIVAAYMPQENFYFNLLLAALIMSAVNFPSISVWTLFGGGVRRLLRRPASVQRFNQLMAVLLIASLYGVVSV